MKSRAKKKEFFMLFEKLFLLWAKRPFTRVRKPASVTRISSLVFPAILTRLPGMPSGERALDLGRSNRESHRQHALLISFLRIAKRTKQNATAYSFSLIGGVWGCPSRKGLWWGRMGRRIALPVDEHTRASGTYRSLAIKQKKPA